MKVFLGGTCNGSTWRDTLIPMLKIDYFNPVVDDWNDDAQAREIEEREKCDYCLYVFTPRMTGTYAIAEVIDDSHRHPEKTLMVPMREDDDVGFKDGSWKSLMMVARMVAQNGGRVFDNLEQVANWLNTGVLNDFQLQVRELQDTLDKVEALCENGLEVDDGAVPTFANRLLQIIKEK